MLFSDVVAQTNLSNRLKEGIRSGKVAHAQLFEGAEGSGYCASAGVVSNADLTVYTCLAPPEVAGDEVSNGTVVWQPGPMYVFVP